MPAYRFNLSSFVRSTKSFTSIKTKSCFCELQCLFCGHVCFPPCLPPLVLNPLHPHPTPQRARKLGYDCVAMNFLELTTPPSGQQMKQKIFFFRLGTLYMNMQIFIPIFFYTHRRSSKRSSQVFLTFDANFGVFPATKTKPSSWSSFCK